MISKPVITTTKKIDIRYNAQRVTEISLIRYVHSQKIRKPNNITFFGSK